MQAMNTGHDGSMCTLHANSPREALTRLENMVAMTGVKLPSRSVRTQIAEAVNLVEIGRAHVGTPVTNAHLVCRLLLEQKQLNYLVLATMKPTVNTHQIP